MTTRLMILGAKQVFSDAVARRPGYDVAALGIDNVDGRPQIPACPTDPRLVYPRGGKFSLRAVRGLRRAIGEFQPDIIHAFYAKALLHAVAATVGLRRRPRIVSFRGIERPLSPWDPIERLSYYSPRVDAHACESEAVRQSLIRSGLPAERCGVLYNCLNGPVSPCDRRQVRAAWGIPADAFVLMTIANARPVKGIDVLLKALLESADLSGLTFVHVGRIEDAKVERLIADPRLTPRMRMLGYQTRAASLAAAADVFVMPSRSEALCVAVLEAMSLGVCPLVSDAGGMKEAVRHERDGLVVPRENVAALAAAIRRLHARRDLVAAYGDSARRRFCEHFSPEAMANRAVELYASLDLREKSVEERRSAA